MPEATENSPHQHVRWLLAIILVGLILRLGVVACLQGRAPTIFDERDYDELATNLATRGEYSYGAGHLTSMRPPLYPAFLAAIYAVAGVHNYLAVRVVQAVLGAAAVLPLYLLARRMFSLRVALGAAGVYAIYPALIGYGALLLSETLFTVLLIGVCLATQQLLADGRLRSAMILGVVLALAALTRSVVWLFPPVLVLFLCWACREQRWPRRLLLGAVSVASFAAVIAPWAIRNTRLERTLTFVDSMGGRNLMMGNYEHTPLDRSWDTITMVGEGKESWHRVLAAEHPEFSQLSQGQRDKLAMRRGLQFMLANPGLTLKRSAVKFFDFWQLERSLSAGASGGFWGPASKGVVILLSLVVCGGQAVVLLAAVFGLFLAPPSDRRMHWFILLLIAQAWAVHTIVFAHSRYQLPFLPLLIMYAVNAAIAWRQGEITWRGWRTWLATSVCVVLVLSWVARLIMSDLGRFV